MEDPQPLQKAALDQASNVPSDETDAKTASSPSCASSSPRTPLTLPPQHDDVSNVKDNAEQYVAEIDVTDVRNLKSFECLGEESTTCLASIHSRDAAPEYKLTASPVDLNAPPEEEAQVTLLQDHQSIYNSLTKHRRSLASSEINVSASSLSSQGETLPLEQPKAVLKSEPIFDAALEQLEAKVDIDSNFTPQKKSPTHPEGNSTNTVPFESLQPTSNRKTLWTMLRNSASVSDIKAAAQVESPAVGDESKNHQVSTREQSGKGKRRVSAPLRPSFSKMSLAQDDCARAMTHDEDLQHGNSKTLDKKGELLVKSRSASANIEGPPPPTPSTKPSRQSVPPPPRRKSSMWDLARSAATRISTSSNTAAPSQQQCETITSLEGDEGKVAYDALRFAHARHVLRTESSIETIRSLALELDEGWREKLKEVGEIHQSLATSQQKHLDTIDENRQLRAQIARLSESLVAKETDFETLQRFTLDSAQRERDELKKAYEAQLDITREESRQRERMCGLERALNAQLRVVLFKLLQESYLRKGNNSRQSTCVDEVNAAEKDDDGPASASACSAEGDLSMNALPSARPDTPSLQATASNSKSDERGNEQVNTTIKTWIDQLNSIPLPSDYLEALQLPATIFSQDRFEDGMAKESQVAEASAACSLPNLPSLTFGQVRERLIEGKEAADAHYFSCLSDD